ncbi:MAG: MarR family transcriptional regulator [Clostridia bacterium]|nr:MarR family transcriptional regulator [Clostridia bacterium]
MPSISRCINTINRASGMFRNANINNEELRPYLQSYILVITGNPGISQEQIARRLCVDKSSVARALAVLQKSDYIKREKDEKDRRIMLVYPTEKAISSREEIKAAYRAWNEYINEGFSAEEAAAFSDLLEKAAKRAAEYAMKKLDDEDLHGEGGDEL